MVSEGHGDRCQEDRRNDRDPEHVETGDGAWKRDREVPEHDDVPAEQGERGAGRRDAKGVEDGRPDIRPVVAQDRAGIRRKAIQKSTRRLRRRTP